MPKQSNYDLEEQATEALEAARLMPPGREKAEALKKAGLLRNAASRPPINKPAK